MSVSDNEATSPRPKILTRQIVVRVEPDLDDWLTKYADEDGRTKAQTIRWILRGVKEGRWEFRG